MSERNRFPKTHGLSRTKIYHIWSTMIDRCHNPNNRMFPRYGGRGICVCEAWRKSFEQFYNDFGRLRPDGLEMDRINNNGDYEPNNVRWVTRSENCGNRSITAFAIHDGVRKPIAEWCKILKFNPVTAISRRLRGWPEDRLLEPPHVNMDYATKARWSKKHEQV